MKKVLLLSMVLSSVSVADGFAQERLLRPRHVPLTDGTRCTHLGDLAACERYDRARRGRGSLETSVETWRNTATGEVVCSVASGLCDGAEGVASRLDGAGELATDAFDGARELANGAREWATNAFDGATELATDAFDGADPVSTVSTPTPVTTPPAAEGTPAHHDGYESLITSSDSASRWWISPEDVARAEGDAAFPDYDWSVPAPEGVEWSEPEPDPGYVSEGDWVDVTDGNPNSISESSFVEVPADPNYYVSEGDWVDVTDGNPNSVSESSFVEVPADPNYYVSEGDWVDVTDGNPNSISESSFVEVPADPNYADYYTNEGDWVPTDPDYEGDWQPPTTTMPWTGGPAAAAGAPAYHDSLDGSGCSGLTDCQLINGDVYQMPSTSAPAAAAAGAPAHLDLDSRGCSRLTSRNGCQLINGDVVDWQPPTTTLLTSEEVAAMRASVLRDVAAGRSRAEAEIAAIRERQGGFGNALGGFFKGLGDVGAELLKNSDVIANMLLNNGNGMLGGTGRVGGVPSLKNADDSLRLDCNELAGKPQRQYDATTSTYTGVVFPAMTMAECQRAVRAGIENGLLGPDGSLLSEAQSRRLLDLGPGIR